MCRPGYRLHATRRPRRRAAGARPSQTGVLKLLMLVCNDDKVDSNTFTLFETLLLVLVL
jgi:hypothetical protein